MDGAGTRVAMHGEQAGAPEAEPRDPWAAVLGQTFYSVGSGLSACPALCHGKMPGRAQGGWLWDHRSLETPVQTPAL